MSDNATTSSASATRIADLERRIERLQKEFTNWRHGKVDVQHLAEEAHYLTDLEHLRRCLDAAKAAPDDHLDRMRLLANWAPTGDPAAAYEYDTPQGRYHLEQNDATQVWLPRQRTVGWKGHFLMRRKRPTGAPTTGRATPGMPALEPEMVREIRCFEETIT